MNNEYRSRAAQLRYFYPCTQSVLSTARNGGKTQQEAQMIAALAVQSKSSSDVHYRGRELTNLHVK